jgi:3-methyladenine DNA glycosylase AlkD
LKTGNKYIKAIETCIIKHDPKLSLTHRNSLAGYIGTNYKILGIGTALQKQLAKQKYNLALNLNDHLPVFDTLFKTSSVFELKSASLLMVEYNYKKTDKVALYNAMIGWVDHVDNWAHSDYLSKFYTRFLEEESLQPGFLKLLKRWNSDKNPWKRRQSLVALLYYARTKKQHLPFKTIISFIETLLDDKEYYVQKGVGWSLRECYSVYPALTFGFADRNHHKISAAAFSAACEKMTGREKEILKRKRKEYRIKTTKNKNSR